MFLFLFWVFKGTIINYSTSIWTKLPVPPPPFSLCNTKTPLFYLQLKKLLKQVLTPSIPLLVYIIYEQPLLYLNPSFSSWAELFNLIFLDWHSTIVKRSLPLESAAISSDVGHFQRSLRSGRTSKDYKLDPLLVETILILGSD